MFNITGRQGNASERQYTPRVKLKTLDILTKCLQGCEDTGT